LTTPHYAEVYTEFESWKILKGNPPDAISRCQIFFRICT
jgi:hypothetical protein